jgi:glycosyltransferase involved in cell wall biosynthesis
LFDANDSELAHVYAHARALVLPSLAEGFGLPLGRSADT